MGRAARGFVPGWLVVSFAGPQPEIGHAATSAHRELAMAPAPGPDPVGENLAVLFNGAA